MLRKHTGTCRSGRCRAWAVTVLALTMAGIVQGQSLAELQAAAKKRDPAAQYQLGRRYLLGLGTPADEKEGFKLLKDAADKGINNYEAMHMVAVCYATESGVKKSERDAFKYFEKAATGGLAEAQFKLGTAYESGLLNLKPDASTAAKWYLAAAKQGHSRAQYKYARLIYQTQDYPAAAEWFRKAAEQGLIEAQVWTGGLYSTGQGVSKDMTEAYKWYLIAARMGHPDAMKKVDQAKASPTYFGEKVITEGQRRAEAYLEQHREREKDP